MNVKKVAVINFVQTLLCACFGVAFCLSISMQAAKLHRTNVAGILTYYNDARGLVWFMELIMMACLAMASSTIYKIPEIKCKLRDIMNVYGENVISQAELGILGHTIFFRLSGFISIIVMLDIWLNIRKS